MRIVALVEATTVNAVARNMFEFHRASEELARQSDEFPPIKLSLITFSRSAPVPGSENAFTAAAMRQNIDTMVINERRRFDLGVIPSVRAAMEMSSVDLILTHSVKSHFLILSSRLWEKTPWIAFHHGYTSTDLKMRLYNQMDRFSLPKAHRVITVCQAFADELATARGVSPERIHVQHNSIRDAPRVTEAEAAGLRTELGIREDEPVILSVGRFSKEKAQKDLLVAFDHFVKANPQSRAKLVLVGEGPERRHLAAAVNSIGLRKRVVFGGQVEKVQPYYAIAAVLASSSHSEGSPYVLLEAMAAGVPIVATAVGGVPEILTDNETALLAPARAPEALSAALSRVLSDSELAQRLSATAKELAKTQFSPEAHVKALLQFYETTISRRHQGVG
jgi:glycosyltransferase involved in cell wall biosynthesis